METDKSLEELRRIKQALDYDEVVKKIEDETIRMVDPQLENYEEELEKRQRENREKIKQTKEDLSDYDLVIERTEINIHKEEQLLIQMKADTTPEGIKALGRQRRKVKEQQNQLLQLRKEYLPVFSAHIRPTAEPPGYGKYDGSGKYPGYHGGDGYGLTKEPHRSPVPDLSRYWYR
jgi:hypothetical protein